MKKHILLNIILGNTILFLLPLMLVSCGGGKVNTSPPPAEQSEAGQDLVIQSALTSLETQVMQLKQSMEDMEFQLEQKNLTIQQLQEKTQALEKKIAALGPEKNRKKKQPQKIIYKDPESLYKKARQLLLEENFSEAADHFSTLINEHQTHPFADNAVYWLAECHYSRGNFQQAVFVFKNLVKKYPKSEKVPDALLKTGYSYLSLGDSNRAHHYFKQVLKKYPFSKASEKAQAKLGEFD